MVQKEPTELTLDIDINRMFDALVSRHAINDERTDLSNFLSDGTQAELHRREQEIATSRRNALARDDIETYDASRDELKEIDYIVGRYAPRAKQRAHEMDRHKDQLWLDAADHEKMTGLQSLIDDSPRISHYTFIGGALTADYSHDVSLHVLGDKDYSIQLPLNNIVDADGFVSWEEGRGHEKMDGSTGDPTASKLVIESFANKPTKAPLIPLVHGFIQQNGTILYKVADGTHRVAAAKLKGETHVQVQELQLQKIDGDIIGLDDTNQI